MYHWELTIGFGHVEVISDFFYSALYSASLAPPGSWCLPSLLPNNCTMTSVVALALELGRKIDLCMLPYDMCEGVRL